MQRLTPRTPLSILGTGMCLPGAPIDNAQVLRRLLPDAADARIEHAAAALTEVHGLQHRHWVAPPGQVASTSSADLAIEAGRAALHAAGLTAADVGALWVATSTPPSWTSALAARVGDALGIEGPCIDLRSGCSGGLHALIHAALAIGAGAGPQLIIGAETFSRVLPLRHRPSFVSMADGAGALLVGAGNGELIATAQHTAAHLHHLVGTRGPMPPEKQAIDADDYRLSGDPAALGEQIGQQLCSAVHAAMNADDCVADDVDALVLHQTHAPMVHRLAAKLGLPADRAVITVQDHANVGSAGWLVALHLARRQGRVGPGQRVVLGAAGGGVTSAAAIWRL